MSEIISETEQVELVNIISISETRLTRNFEIILRHLKATNQRIDSLDRRLADSSLDTLTHIDALRAHGHEVQHKLIDIVTEIGSISSTLTAVSTDMAVKQGEQSIRLVDLELVSKQLNDKIENMDKSITLNIQDVANQQTKMRGEVVSGTSKQNYNIEKLEKEVTMLVMKTESSSNKSKFAEERIETLERQVSGEDHVRLQDIIIDKVFKELSRSSHGKSRRDIGTTNNRKEWQRGDGVGAKGEVGGLKGDDLKVPTRKDTKLSTSQRLQQEKMFGCVNEEQSGSGELGIREQRGQRGQRGQRRQRRVEMKASVNVQKKTSMKGLEIKISSRYNSNSNNQSEENDSRQYIYEDDGSLPELSELRSAIEKMKAKIKHLEIANSEPLSVLIDNLKRDIHEVKSFNEEIKKDVVKMKTDSSASNFTEKLQELRPELNKVWGVISGAEDKNIFLERKLQEMKKTLVEVSTYVKENNTSRFDEKIRMLQSDFFSQIKELTSKLELKTNSSDFFKLCADTSQNFREVRSSLSNKCEKVEVKKALLFIESKIKEIILVISEDEEYEKDALLTKKTIKCISCDKDLDKPTGLVNTDSRNWNMMPQRDMHPENFGKCGISRFGSLASKIRKLEGSQLPVLKSKGKEKDKEKEKENREM